MLNRIRDWFCKKPERIEISDKQMRGIESFSNLYHGAVRKYGDDGHDQFVELMKRVYDEQDQNDG